MRRVLLCTMAILFASSTPAIAAPVWGDQMDLSQPDGSLVPVRIWGDEYYQKVQSLDGRALVRDPAGWIRYASVAEDSSAFLPTGSIYTGTVASSGGPAARRSNAVADLDISQAARNAQVKANWDALHRWAPANNTSISDIPDSREAAETSTGGVRHVTGLTILVDFSDQVATIPTLELFHLLNGQDYTGFGNNGSVRDFFSDISDGKLLYSNVVAPYVRLSKPKSYYDDPTIPFGARGTELVQEALAAVSARGFDFSQLTTDAQGNVLALNILYAGVPRAGWARGIWPHMNWMQGVSHGGRRFGVYELSNIGSAPAIGVICHENGHMVMGWPDLYDYSGASQGTGGYDLMSSANPYNPVPPNAWLRDQAGWDSTTRLEGLPIGTSFKLPSNANRNLRMDNPTNPREHWYVESRIRKGRNLLLPDEGLMVWHIDENGSNSFRQSSPAGHYLVSLVQADGKLDLERGKATGPGDLFHAGHLETFDATTNPSSAWWNNTASNFKLAGIGPVSDTMTLAWNGGGVLAQARAALPHNPIAGLAVGYAEGTWPSVPTFTLTSFLKKGTASTISSTFPSGRATDYALAYDGYFNAPQAGNYSFTATSDGPARVFLDTTLRADLPAGGSKTFVLGLAQGAHVFRALYVHGAGTPQFTLSAAGPGLPGGAIPASAWTSEEYGMYASDAATLPMTSRGLRSAYYEGTWTSLPDFSALPPVRTGLTGSVNLASAGATRAQDWAMVLKGWIKVDRLGTYVFSLGSTDGSRLVLDGTTLVENDGSHAARTLVSTIPLWPGYHRVQLEFYQHAWNPWLEFKMAAPGGPLSPLGLASLANDSSLGLLPQDVAEPVSAKDPIWTESGLSVRAEGRMVEVAPPSGYMGPISVEVLDLMGHVQGSVAAASMREVPNVRLLSRSGASMVLVRVRMTDRVETRKVPLAR
ncbi:MAG: M6 family metalloprotease domain-containing protein [Fibrobacteres bacterium]|nr:M6 family metalloprotease domain-containing protein [Fibrobacterota bacterium]